MFPKAISDTKMIRKLEAEIGALKKKDDHFMELIGDTARTFEEIQGVCRSEHIVTNW